MVFTKDKIVEQNVDVLDMGPIQPFNELQPRSPRKRSSLKKKKKNKVDTVLAKTSSIRSDLEAGTERPVSQKSDRLNQL